MIPILTPPKQVSIDSFDKISSLSLSNLMSSKQKYIVKFKALSPLNQRQYLFKLEEIAGLRILRSVVESLKKNGKEVEFILENEEGHCFKEKKHHNQFFFKDRKLFSKTYFI